MDSILDANIKNKKLVNKIDISKFVNNADLDEKIKKNNQKWQT